jgi:hypothetical protein
MIHTFRYVKHIICGGISSASRERIAPGRGDRIVTRIGSDPARYLPPMPTASSARPFSPRRTGSSPTRSCSPRHRSAHRRAPRPRTRLCPRGPSHRRLTESPLGKLDSERMVLLDDDTVALINRIAETRSPGLPGNASRKDTPLIKSRSPTATACAPPPREAVRQHLRALPQLPR